MKELLILSVFCFITCFYLLVIILKRTLYSSRRLIFNELTKAKNLVLHSSHFALN
jgi:hypothetical protein